MRTRRSHRPEHLNDNWNSDTDDNSNDFDNGDRAGGPADLGRESGQEFGQEFGREGSRGGRRRGAGFRRRRRAFAASAGFGPRFAGQEFGPPDDEHDPDFGRRGPRGRGRGGPGRFGPGSGPGGFGPGGFGPGGPGGFGPGGFGLGGPGGPGGPGGRGGRGGPGGHGPGGGRGRRARGNVRAAVLALLAEEPRHGYSIMTELAERSGGLWRPSPGSVYPVLQQLQDEKLVTAEESDGRKVFSITDAGRALIEANPGEFAEPWSVAGPGPRQRVQTLFEGMTALGSATQQVARLGTAAQAERARLVLDEARRALYRILAEDEEAAATPASPAANPAGEAAAPAKDDHAPPGE